MKISLINLYTFATLITFYGTCNPIALCQDTKTQQPKIESAISNLEKSPVIPNRYAVIIGANEYSDKRITPLDACENDAKKLYEILTDPKIGFFPKDNVQLLIGEKVKSSLVKDALDQLGKKSTPNDIVLVFFSGHGAIDERQRPYWIMQDTDIDKLRATGLAENELSNLFSDIKSTRFIIIIDACYSAATANVSPIKSPGNLEQVFNQFTGSGRVILSASRGDQLSLVIRSPQHQGNGYSVFAWHLIQGLSGASDTDQGGDGIVTFDELWTYVKDRTIETAHQLGGKQEPQVKGQFGSRFVLTVNQDRLVQIEKKRESDAKESKAATISLIELLREKKISAHQFESAVSILGTPPEKLSGLDRTRREIYIDLSTGKLKPDYFTLALKSTEERFGEPILRLELIDEKDPIALGNTITYTISISNTGTGTAKNVRIETPLNAKVEYISSDGPTTGKKIEGILKFDPLLTLKPNEKSQWNIKLKPKEAGDFKFTVKMSSDNTKDTDEETESSSIYIPQSRNELDNP